VPVRRILMGVQTEKAASRDATQNADALDWFERFAAEGLSEGQLS
jgi:acetoacetyl-CoA synthetase